VLAAAKKLGDEDRLRPGIISGGNEDGSVHAVLAHILGAEVIWLRRWQGDALARLPGSSDYPSLEVLEQAWSDLERSRQKWLEELLESDLVREIEFLSVTRGVMERFPLHRTLLHVSNHSTHHRGEVSAALSALGSPPESVDLIDYMRFRRDTGMAAT
jgi:uncharacterized damage-inducible protein DinB